MVDRTFCRERRWRFAGMMILLVSLSACGGSDGTSGADNAIRASSEYMSLLAEFPLENQGRGVDSLTPEQVLDHATAYAQVLSSEAYRHQVEPGAETASRIRLAARWLVDNSDLDADGKKGWGFPFAWDAFGDGSVNPANHVYTIDTAIVLLGLLDALDAGGIWSDGERTEIIGLIRDVLARWCTELWTQPAGGGGYFWYSPVAEDSAFLPNVSAMLCGVLQRFLHDYGSGLTAGETALFTARADDGILLIENSVSLFQGMPFWDYIESDGWADRTNDLVHHVYILYGVRMYKEFGGTVPVRWSAQDALGSVRLFASGGVTYNYPHDPWFAYGGMNLSNPANVWGMGMLIAYAAGMGDGALADTTLDTIKASYGDFPDMAMFPPNGSSDTRVYPRHTAHVLFGLAVRDFRPVKGSGWGK